MAGVQEYLYEAELRMGRLGTANANKIGTRLQRRQQAKHGQVDGCGGIKLRFGERKKKYRKLKPVQQMNTLLLLLMGNRPVILRASLNLCAYGCLLRALPCGKQVLHRTPIPVSYIYMSASANTCGPVQGHK